MYYANATILLAVLLLAPSSAAADSGGFWAGAEFGVGSMWRSSTVTNKDSTIYMAFKGAYVFSERLLLGIELGGHTLEAGNLWDPSKGAGFSQVMLLAQYYLQPVRSGWYVKGAAGTVNYWDNNPGAQGESGTGVTIAVGHEWRTESLGNVGPLISFDYGNVGNTDYRAIALALSWSFP